VSARPVLRPETATGSDAAAAFSRPSEKTTEVCDNAVKTFLLDGRREVHPACRFRGPQTEGVGEVHTGASHHLFHPDQIINGKEDEVMNDAGGD
jgi:hypothetical protein